MPTAGILGWKRSKYQRPILHSSKSPETSRKMFSEYIKNTQRKRFTRGATPYPRGWGARPTPLGAPPTLWGPGGPPMAVFCYMESFDEKNHKPSSWRKLRRHEAEPWRNQSRAPAELFCRGNFPLGGGNRSHRHHQQSSHRDGVNLHQHLHQHHLLSNPSSSLVSNLCLKISYWYLWVASSVDYSLQLMLVGLFGGRSYVQILNDIYYPSDYEHEHAL